MLDMTPPRCGLNLGEAAINEQFRSRDVAAVVGCEKHHGLGALLWCAGPADRNTARRHLQVLLGRFGDMPRGCVDEARAHGVDANAAILQVRRPCPRERAHGGLGGVVHAPLRRSYTASDGRIQDDRGTIRHQRKRLLHREQEALHVDVEDRVVVLLGDLAEGGICRHTGVREDNVEPALLLLDLGEEAIEIAKVRYVALDAGNVASDFLDRRSQITAPRDEDVRALVYKLLRRRKANAAIATGNERDLAFELAHALLLCSEDVHAADDAGTPVLYLGAGKELPNCFARARRWASKRVHSSPSWRPGIVTSSPRSSPTRAASTMSSGDMTIDAGRFWYGSPAIAQSSVAVAPGSTAWMRRPLSASSCCSEWLSAMT